MLFSGFALWGSGAKLGSDPMNYSRPFADLERENSVIESFFPRRPQFVEKGFPADAEQGAFDEILQLSNVAGEGVVDKRFEGVEIQPRSNLIPSASSSTIKTRGFSTSVLLMLDFS